MEYIELRKYSITPKSRKAIKNIYRHRLLYEEVYDTVNVKIKLNLEMGIENSSKSNHESDKVELFPNCCLSYLWTNVLRKLGEKIMTKVY